jgi:molybdopterin-guanine dinucleotide biosynthesis protein A
MKNTIARDEVTGVILAGGRGSRMGGVDKGLQQFRGVPLAMHALQRLAPQVGHVLINANRNLDVYAALGAPVFPDPLPDYAGPLAGWLAGLERCPTPYMVTVPCDTPGFPTDLVARLSAALLDADAEIAMAVTLEGNTRQTQPVFSLMRRGLAPNLSAFLHSGQSKVMQWACQQRRVEVVFDDARAFFNVNTAVDLRQLQAG